jgi:hypothetical protein
MKKIPSIIISRIIGLMLFLIFLYILNNIEFNVDFYDQFVLFLNNNAVLIIVMSLLFMLSEIFYVIMFPVKLISPIFSAGAALLLVMFIFRIFNLIDMMIMINLFQIFSPLSFILYPLVFFMVLIISYVIIIIEHLEKEKKDTKDKT